MLRWCEARAKEVATGHARGPRLFQTWAFDTMPDKIALVESEGYARVRYGFLMVRPLSEPMQGLPLPAGIEVRPKLRQHYRAVFDAIERSVSRSWGHRELTENDWRSFSNGLTIGPELCQVAWDRAKSNAVVGECA